MRKSKILAKLRSGQFARICCMGHFLPFYIHYAAQFKYDGVWLDLEHRAMDAREVQSLLAFCHLNDIDCMIRPPTLERTRLYRYLEDGASGLMIPFASNVEAAKHVVRAVKFPPVGNRGVDGAGLDGDYGSGVWNPGSTYFTDANRETFILAQIETPEAVSQIDAIAEVPGIDGLFVGPADLRLRLSMAESAPKLNFGEAVELVAASARRFEKVWGIAIGSLDDLTRYRKMGAQIIPWGGDFDLLKVLETRSKELDEHVPL
jgi:4-hydroxy-2-oxoheptanedioate aldolase